MSVLPAQNELHGTHQHISPKHISVLHTYDECCHIMLLGSVRCINIETHLVTYDFLFSDEGTLLLKAHLDKHMEYYICKQLIFWTGDLCPLNMACFILFLTSWTAKLVTCLESAPGIPRILQLSNGTHGGRLQLMDTRGELSKHGSLAVIFCTNNVGSGFSWNRGSNSRWLPPPYPRSWCCHPDCSGRSKSGRPGVILVLRKVPGSFVCFYFLWSCLGGWWILCWCTYGFVLFCSSNESYWLINHLCGKTQRCNMRAVAWGKLFSKEVRLCIFHTKHSTDSTCEGPSVERGICRGPSKALTLSSCVPNHYQWPQPQFDIMDQECFEMDDLKNNQT